MKLIQTAALLAFALVAAPLSGQEGSDDPPEEDGTLYACYVPNSGVVYRIRTPDTADECGRRHIEFTWQEEGPVGPPGPPGPEGPPGPTGEFTGQLVSPNGQFTLSVTDHGIFLTSPGATLTMDLSGLSINAGDNSVLATSEGIELVSPGHRIDLSADRVVVSGATQVDVSSATTTVVGGPDLRLRGTDSFDAFGRTLTVRGGEVGETKLLLASDFARLLLGTAAGLRIEVPGSAISPGASLFHIDGISLNGRCDPVALSSLATADEEYPSQSVTGC